MRKSSSNKWTEKFDFPQTNLASAAVAAWTELLSKPKVVIRYVSRALYKNEPASRGLLSFSAPSERAEQVDCVYEKYALLESPESSAAVLRARFALRSDVL